MMPNREPPIEACLSNPSCRPGVNDVKEAQDPPGIK
jgi:hypothetical protein